MKRLVAIFTFLVLFAVLPLVGCGLSSAQEPATKTGGAAKGRPKKVIKTDAEWQRILSRDSYLVTRHKMTEPAGTGKYANYHGKGTFECVGCGTPLFDAKNKFESGTGWPSFDRPVAKESIATADDYTEAEPRVEVTCAVCDAHLGHVFGDGPTRTGLRYCINSASLKLVAPAATEAKGKAKSAPKGKTTNAVVKSKGAKKEESEAKSETKDAAPAEGSKKETSQAD